MEALTWSAFSMRHILVLTFILNLCQHARPTQTTSAQYNTDLQGLTVTGNNVIVGADNWVYKLNASSLVQRESRQLNKKSTTLIGYYDASQVLLCTSKEGQCEFLRTSDLSTLRSSGPNIVTNYDDGRVIYVKAGFRKDNMLSDTLFLTSSLYSSPVTPGTSEEVRSIFTAARKPSDFQWASVKPPTDINDPTPIGSALEYALSYSQLERPYTDPEITTSEHLYAFAAHDWIFYVKNLRGRAYIGGLCNSDPLFSSLVELPLICNGGGMQKTYLQAVSSGKAGPSLLTTLGHRNPEDSVDANTEMLFGVFAENSESTSVSVCIFVVPTLMAMMERTFRSCHITGTDTSSISYGPKSVTDGFFQTSCEPLADAETQYPAALTACQIIKEQRWGRIIGYSPLVNSRTEPITADVISLDFAVNDILLSQVGHDTVGFMSSADGFIRKVVINQEGSGLGRLYHTHQVTNMSPNTKLLPHLTMTSSHIITLSKDKVFSIPIYECETATTCGACATMRDPHCGWCALTNKCTVSSQCDESDSAGHWIQGMGTSQTGCIIPTIDGGQQYSVETSTNNDNIRLKIYLNIVPTAHQNEYKCCLFGESGSETCSPATRQLETGANQVERDFLLCNTSRISTIAARISEGEDHIVTNLALKILDATFVTQELTFYDCSKHSTCSSCAAATVAFKCTWCLESYTCNMRRSSTCDSDSVGNKDEIISHNGVLKGSGYCPKFNKTDPGSSNVMLIPSGTSPTLKFNVWNQLPSSNNFRCIVSWDNQVQRNLSAGLISGSPGSTTLMCDVDEPFFYSEQNRTKVAKLAIQVGGGNHYLDNENDIQFEMYKCGVMSGTCGQCLSPDNNRYQCGWCQALTSRCDVKQLCPITATFLMSTGTSNCPFLEITDIEPTDGPLEGQTKVKIIGENMGSTFSEIENGIHIRLANNDLVKCNPIEASYTTQLLYCKTAEANVGSGPVVVSISGGASLTATSKKTFSFYAPNVTGLSSTRGPVSGGSVITIYGQNINIGSRQSVVMSLGDGTSKACNITEQVVGVERNRNEIKITTPPVPSSQNVSIMLTVDGYFNDKTRFSFVADPIITGLKPNRTILAGGTYTKVTGTGLDLVESPRMYIKRGTSASSRRRRRFSRAAEDRKEMSCENVTSTEMTCTLPPVPESWLGSPIQYGFVLDGVKGLDDLAGKDGLPTFSAVNNPEFKKFKDELKITPELSTLKINGTHLLILGSDDIVKPMLSVNITATDAKAADKPLSCSVTHVQDNLLYCNLPVLDSSKKYRVSAGYGSLLSEDLGVISTSSESILTTEMIIGIGAASAVFVIIVIIVIVVLKCRVTKTNQGMKKLQDKMDNLEMTVAKECKEAFTELQTDMTEMTADIAALHGLPFFEYNNYCMKVLFPTQNENDHPVMKRLEVPGGKEQVERGLHQFGRLVNNKTFLLTFIRTLEQQRKFAMRDRVEVASLVSVALQPKMEYHTDILKTLLAELIERTIETKKDPKILMRRNESVAEKMLSNWFAFLLQKFLKECAGEPLYLLYRAIKQQVDKGPVDAVTADAKYSLSEDKLLRQTVEFQSITLKFRSPDEHAAQDPQTVKALSCDTISQAIDKILDTVYRNVPYSNTGRPLKGQLILEWLKPNGERIPMYDDDPTFSKIESDNCKRMATLACYEITDGSMVALLPKQQFMDAKSSLPRHDTTSSNGNYYGSTGDSLSRANSMNNILDTNTGTRPEKRVHRYHLVKPSEADTHQEGERNKMVSEIYLTRLLATKGTLQQFVDDLFETIFSTAHRGSALPLAIKYMFDFLDDQALLHNISNPDVIHHWKSNSLPLRFWVNVIKNPDFVFDIHKSNIVDACLSVVAQIFMDSCSLSEHRLGKESPSSKLLYAKDIPKYRSWVDRYYSDIKSMPAISDHDMNATLFEESRQHRNEFNTSASLFELYQYVLQYLPEVLGALREDEFARKDHLAEDLEYVNQMLNVSSFART